MPNAIKTINTLLSSEDIFALAVNASLCIEIPEERVNLQLKILESLNKHGFADYAFPLLPVIVRQLLELPESKERSYLLLLLIRQQCSMKLFDDAEKTLSLLSINASSGDSHYSGALSDIASALAQNGETLRALELADETEDLDDYESILELCGKFYAGLQKFSEVIQSAAKIEAPLPRFRLLMSLAAEQWNSGLHNESLQTLYAVQTIADGIPDESIRNDVYLQLIDSFIAVQRVFDALTVSKKIPAPEKQAEAFCKTALFLHQSGNVSGAQTAANDALVAARKVSDTYRRIDSLALSGGTFHRNGETETAKEIFRECLSLINTVNNGYSKVRILTAFAEEMFSLGIVSAAAKVFQNALVQTSYIEEKTSQLISLSKIAQCQAECQLPEDIPQTIQKITDFGDEGFGAEIETGLYERVLALAQFDYGLALYADDAAERRTETKLAETKNEGLRQMWEAINSMQKNPDPVNRTISLIQTAEHRTSYGL